MKSIIVKTAVAGVMAICLNLAVQAAPIKAGLSDTTKKSKMSKMDSKMDSKMEKDKMAKEKMDKKMEKKKMAKDTGKMSKMSKM